MTGTYRWDAVGTLVVTALAIMGTPGPATISLTAAGSAYGVRRSLSYLAGIIAGTTAVLLAVATGITAALLALPAVRPVLLAAGAAYIVWLAYHIATAPPLLGADGGHGRPLARRRRTPWCRRRGARPPFAAARQDRDLG